PPRGAPAQRIFLWTLLVAALLALATATIWMRGFRPRAGATSAGGPAALFAVPEFTLVDRDGRPFGSRDLPGAPHTAAFVLPRRRGVCPLIVERMKRMTRLLERHPELVRVSITVDPEYDTPSVLEAYAREHGVAAAASSRWHFLTGEPSVVKAL